MLAKKVYAILLWVQAVYMLVTALWGLIDIISFMKVTGPKTDIWLVKTVSVLLIPITLLLFSALYFKLNVLPVSIVAATTAAGLAFIDFYYTGNHIIKWVYAIDGIVQTIFLCSWVYLLTNIARAGKR
jgi:hypothetical protein